jgi:hypothetical protein
MRAASTAVSLLIALTLFFLGIKPVFAASYFFSASGTGNTCSQSAPCSLATALSGSGPSSEYEISCADSSESGAATIEDTVTIDCAGTTGSLGALTINLGNGNNPVVTLRNFTIARFPNPILLQRGTLILDNVHISTAGLAAINAAPVSPSTLIVKNSIFEKGASGVIVKPVSGGSLNAVFDHVTIVGNDGGGLRFDTTSGGPIAAEITNSVISYNAGNGINVINGPAGQDIVNIENSVIAKNGAAGI